MLGFIKRRRRNRLLASALAEQFWAIIDRRVPLIRSLSSEDRAKLGGIINVLLREKRFEGCGGLVITDEIRVTIAAQAALLLLNRETEFYPTLRTILVYPAAYAATVEHVNADGSVATKSQRRLGESWHRGSVVLSWADVLRGAELDNDGHNVVLHEFAHQLDGEDGTVNGAPALPSAARYREWARVLSREYAELIDDIHRGHSTLLDPYGATNPQEFFSVATEFFFERPRAMRKKHPELFEQLALFYAMNPAETWR